MKSKIIISGLSAMTSLLLSAQPEQPNIVLFLVDDMGWQDTSVPFWEQETPFNQMFHTPNMERLAKQGMKFTSAYTCSVSSPTRVSLFTGMNAARHRVTNWTLYRNQEVDSKHKVLDYPLWNVNGLSPVTGIKRTCYALPLAQALKDGGYYNYLEQNNLSNNTIIIFMSDNGGLSVEPNVRSGKPNTHNWPLNSGKGSAYEGGIRVPMIVSWPRVTKAGSSCDDYLIIEDFYPTLLEMANVDMPKTPQVIDGKSFVSLLTKKGKNPSEGRLLYWNFPNNWGPVGPSIGATCTIRKDDWKLIYYYETGRKELFNIREDIGEKWDLSAEEPERVEKLSEELSDYLRKVRGQRPIFKETGKIPWPDEAFKTENLADKPWADAESVKNGSWRGFKVYESKLNEFRIWIAEPKAPAEGCPWILRIQDFGDGYHCDMNEMLLQAGIHVAAINSYNVYGADYGLNLMDSLYIIARKHFNLPEKCALGCVSRAGLSAYRWAVRHPEWVACIYGEGPVMDFKTWPMDWIPSADNWTKLKEYYGFTSDQEAIAYKGNPVDNLAPITKAKIPLRHVISLTDEHDTKIVPNDKNTLKAQRILKQMGHDIDVVVTPEGMKAPYAFDGESVQFILSKTISANKLK